MDRGKINTKEEALELLLDDSLKGVMEKSKDGSNWGNGSLGFACESFFRLYNVAKDFGIDSQMLGKYLSKYIKANKFAQEKYQIYRRKK